MKIDQPDYSNDFVDKSVTEAFKFEDEEEDNKLVEKKLKQVAAEEAEIDTSATLGVTGKAS
jgi:hypothetical protein